MRLNYRSDWENVERLRALALMGDEDVLVVRDELAAGNIQPVESVDAVSQEDVTEENWRGAMTKVCAELQGKTLLALEEEYSEDVKLAQFKADAFLMMPENFRPRDLVDFVIMTTLQTRDSFNTQNARSWMFNLMDRTGNGYVYRDEFVRYAALMQPVADPAVAGPVFRELVNPNFSGTQTKVEPDAVEASGSADIPVPDETASVGENIDAGTSGILRTSGESLLDKEPIASVDPPQVPALMYETWKRYVEKLKKVYNRTDPEWENAKEVLGLDPLEPLVKAQAAIDHSDTFPTPGKLFLSERYLVFLASIGTRHYVIRLGSISEIQKYAVPALMRDCIRLTVEPEVRSHLKGVAGDALTNINAPSGSTANKSANLGQQAATTVRLHSISGEPVIFSFHEFRVAQRRDVWITYLTEMLAAHRLHASFGFGSKGRPPPNSSDWAAESLSPFANDPPPPLFAVGAAVNILRSRALKSATGKRTSRLMLFSNLDVNSDMVKWYSDSIQAFDSTERRSWVTRAVQSIVENMEINTRIYEVDEDEPFEVSKLGEGIARFYELSQPAFTAYEAYERLVQWRNPPATLLAILVCFYIAYNKLTGYIPAILLLAYASLIVGFRVKLVGFKGSDAAAAAASAQARSQGTFQLVTQVHDALHAAQNVVVRTNKQLGRVQTLHVWGIPGMTWIFVLSIAGSAFILAFVPFRFLFVLGCIDLFTRHFRYPDGVANRFWDQVPADLTKFETKSQKKLN